MGWSSTPKRGMSHLQTQSGHKSPGLFLVVGGPEAMAHPSPEKGCLHLPHTGPLEIPQREEAPEFSLHLFLTL